MTRTQSVTHSRYSQEVFAIGLATMAAILSQSDRYSFVRTGLRFISPLKARVCVARLLGRPEQLFPSLLVSSCRFMCGCVTVRVRRCHFRTF